MANLKLSRSQNVPGNFFVDNTCIDCGTCYWVDPKTFHEAGGQSAVYQQPQNNLDAAYRALYSCPTNSIGVQERDSVAKSVLEDFPYELAPGIYHTGFHAENSFGAASYYIKNNGENILIDSPRYLKQLSSKMQSMGGVKYQLLTHKDDVADTDLYWNDFQGKRLIHQDDSNSRTKHYEGFFTGEESLQLTEFLTVIPVPGHTKGSVCFLYQNKYLFTGDHLAFSPELGHLYAFKGACWYDFKTQIKSMEKLLDYDFEYVLPGHDAPYFASKELMQDSLKKCISWMKN